MLFLLILFSCRKNFLVMSETLCSNFKAPSTVFFGALTAVMDNNCTAFFLFFALEFLREVADCLTIGLGFKYICVNRRDALLMTSHLRLLRLQCQLGQLIFMRYPSKNCSRVRGYVALLRLS